MCCGVVWLWCGFAGLSFGLVVVWLWWAFVVGIRCVFVVVVDLGLTTMNEVKKLFWTYLKPEVFITLAIFMKWLGPE